MKRFLYIIFFFLCLSISLHAQSLFNGRIVVRDLSMDIDEQRTTMTISMKLLQGYSNIKSNSWVTVTPKITNGNDTLNLSPVMIYGKLSYYDFVRNNKVEFKKGTIKRYKAKEAPIEVDYKVEVPYQMWMEQAELIISEQREWCCHYPMHIAESSVYVRPMTIVYKPEFVYVSPKSEVVKSRSISATAYINFPAGKTEVNPYYSNNRAELGKIMSTIDSVRTDKDITVSSLFLKGYASPEGMYPTNVTLSKARTQSLKNYILEFAPQLSGVVTTESVPENWDDLRKFVEESNITHKDEILEVINSSREPDNKEWVLKSRYKTEYRYLLDVCYPLLRRTDYTIDYTIRSYTDPQEILKIMFEAPQKLSLQEFYLASQVLEPGSHQFNEAFDIAVKMYPNDCTANLNAANAAMEEGNLTAAERYLSKAGDSPQADYARGVWYAMSEDYMKAKDYFSLTSESIPQAAEALAVIEYLLKK